MDRIKLIRSQLQGNNTNHFWVTKFVEGFEFKNVSDLKGKTLFITGGSRGIGLAIALRAARDGANIAVVAKTVTEQKSLPGTIYTAVEEINKLGGRGLAIQCDIRSEENVKKAIELTVQTFGGIDILVNNASAISLTQSHDTDMKRFDLMMSINTRGTFLCSKYCIPHLKKSKNPHILTLSPPVDNNIKELWFAPHVAYSTSKFGMSLVTLGLSGELRIDGIGVNSLWPRTSIATAAVSNIIGGDSMMKLSRKVEIMGDAAYVILTSDSRKTTGQFFIDDEVMKSSGVNDLSIYSMAKGAKDDELAPDFFV
jgi:citronellol/citronellal dehydrogenase